MNNEPLPQKPVSRLSPRTPLKPSSLSLHSPKKRGPIIAAIIVIVLLLAGAFITVGIWWYNNALQPVSSQYQQVGVEIPEGASIERVSQLLEQAGVVHSALATQLYIRQTGRDNIKAGHYVLSPNQSVAEIVSWLNEGRVNTLKVTILPGKTIGEIKETLVTVGFTRPEVDAAFAKNYNHPLFAGKPANTGLEGYIYPDTYFVLANDPVEEVLERTFDEFEQKLTETTVRQQLLARGFSLYEGITLASLVYGEVPKPEDQRIVAQVFLSRLQIGMVLGSDVSFKYAAKLLGIPPSPNIDSPYNTRKVTGLPPGPVSNIPIGALQAVVNPSDTTYLYFVSGDDGTTHFSHTFEEHEQNIQQYCTTLCQ